MGVDTMGRVSGPTILLLSGRYFDVTNPLDPAPVITDVAWRLAFLNRWNGQTRHPKTKENIGYSVAQHCCHAADVALAAVYDPKLLVPRDLAYAALMHELGEFAWGDIAGPFKALIPDYKSMEKETEAVLANHFDAAIETYKDAIKTIDKRLMATERRDLMNWNGTDVWSYIGDHDPYLKPIEPWGPHRAFNELMQRYYSLRPKRIAF